VRLEKRIKKIFNNIEKKPDVILIKNSEMPFFDNNFFYVTGLTHGLFEGSLAILFPDGKMDLIVTRLEAETAEKTDANVKVYKDENEFYETLKNSVSSHKNIGLNFKGISHRDFLKIKKKLSDSDFTDVSDSIAKTRLVKDEIEIKLIRDACKITDKVMENIPQIVHDGICEYELAAEIDYLIQKNIKGTCSEKANKKNT